MFVSHNYSSFVLGVTAVLSLSACNGIFESVYDEPLPDENCEYGFIIADSKTGVGRIYIDATDYTEWHYVDLHSKNVETLSVGAEPPSNWDFAVHRYDVKTNNAAVWKSESESFDLRLSESILSNVIFEVDTLTSDKITIDMSQMMNGVIVHATDNYNVCLSSWLDVDTSTMPPIYTLSGKVYVVHLSDGTYAALRLVNFMNDAAVKGFMTIDYLYPVEL